MTPPSPHPVILTKVRTQGSKRCILWLWVLTFVRMTREGGVHAKARRREEKSPAWLTPLLPPLRALAPSREPTLGYAASITNDESSRTCLFPREGGDPDWTPAFAGEQGRDRDGGNQCLQPRSGEPPFLTGRSTDPRSETLIAVLHRASSAPSPHAGPRPLAHDTASTDSRRPRREILHVRLYFLYFTPAAPTPKPNKPPHSNAMRPAPLPRPAHNEKGRGDHRPRALFQP